MASNELLWLLLPLAAIVLIGLWLWLRRSPSADAVEDSTVEDAVAAVPEAPVDARPATAAPPIASSPIEAAVTVPGGPVTAIGIPAAVGDPDDLRLMKGVGPKLNTLLNDLGVSRYDQIAAWTAADVDRVDAHLGQFKGRIVRDAWVEQARLLAAGDKDGFKARFGAI